MSDFSISQMRPEDLDGVVALQRACFPPPFPEDHLWQTDHLVNHLLIFPEAQFVATIGDTVVGSCSNAKIEESLWQRRPSWERLLGDFYLSGHYPHGEILFGADISVHPSHRKQGIAKALYSARLNFVRQEGLSAYATACRIPGASSYSGPVSAYVAEVVDGQRTDRTLTPLLRMGLTCVGVIEDFMDDEESCNAAAALEYRL